MDEITLTSHEYSLQTFGTIIRNQSKDHEVKYLKLYFNFYPPLLKEISQFHPSLAHLLILNLSYNNIQSLQPLQHFDLQHLEELHLFHNHICSIRTLRKCNMPCLRMVSLVNNVLRGVEELPEWDCPRLQTLLMYDNPLYIAMKSIIKMRTNLLQHIILSDDAIEDEEMMQFCYYIRFKHYQIS